MSCPRCRWASKISASGGTTRSNSSSHCSTRPSAARTSINGVATEPILDRVTRVPDVLIHGDTYRSPELRHQVPIGIPDPFLYAEIGAVKHIVIGSMEIPRLSEVGGYELHPFEELGSDGLIADGMSYAELRHEVPLRAIERFGLRSAIVPETFPLWFADALRARGVELTVDNDYFDELRRVKSPAQLAGMRRAQRAAEAGMDAARDLLRRASGNGDGLAVDGEPLTVERVKVAISEAFVRLGATCDEFIV